MWRISRDPKVEIVDEKKKIFSGLNGTAKGRENRGDRTVFIDSRLFFLLQFRTFFLGTILSNINNIYNRHAHADI